MCEFLLNKCYFTLWRPNITILKDLLIFSSGPYRSDLLNNINNLPKNFNTYISSLCNTDIKKKN